MNIVKLDLELKAAGLLIDGVAEDGRIDWPSEPTPGQLASAAAVIAAHDPHDYEADVQAKAEDQARAIPNWARWTEAEVLAWHDTNVKNALTAATTAAQIKAVLQVMEIELRAMARMMVALRNAQWPNLQERD